MTARAKPLALIAALSAALSGCGSVVHRVDPAPRVPAGAASAGVAPSVVRVIVGWSEALRAGHVAAAARYFQIPSVFSDGSGPLVELRSVAQAEAVNAALPCGARLLSAQPSGGYYPGLQMGYAA